MRVICLDPCLEPTFWEYVREDIPHYYFFILDMNHERAFTRILLALNARMHIEGMMLIYRERIVQLRGNVETARALLSHLDMEMVEIQGMEEHEVLILEKYKNVKKTLELTLMTLRRGEESPRRTHNVERLTQGDAEDVAALMRQGDPEWWREATAEGIARNMEQRLWMGIRVKGELVSIGGATIDEWGSNIGTVVTHEEHRNRGYATSVVSTLVESIFKKSSLALIHVESANTPAVKAYTKVGFNPYRRYFVARTE